MPDQALLEGAFLERLERLALVTRRRVSGQGKGDRRSIRKGTSIEFVDYRHYTPGDDPRSVDWNIYRRSGNLYVKQFEEEEIVTAHVLVDVSRSMDWGSPSKLQFASRLAAALGYIVLAGSSRLVVTTLSGATATSFGPAWGRRSVAGLIEFLQRERGARRDRPGRRAGQLRAAGVAGPGDPDQRPAHAEVRAGDSPPAGSPVRGHDPARPGAGRDPPADERRPDVDRP